MTPHGLAEQVYCLIRFKRGPWLLRKAVKPFLYVQPFSEIAFRLWRRGQRTWNTRMYAQERRDFLGD